MVGASGFEPPASWSRTRRSTRLSHAPNTNTGGDACDSSSLIGCEGCAQARTIEFVTPSGKLRELPAVHEVLERMPLECSRFPRTLVAAEVRRALEQARAEIRAGKTEGGCIETRASQALDELERPSLRRVINATGVVLHTNLGRAPLGRIEAVSGYSNLEYDLAKGRRGKRDVHVSALLERLLGAPGIAVNNNAAAVFLALNELAGGGEAIVSRGELIEIGDGFRIPDIMARSGASCGKWGPPIARKSPITARPSMSVPVC